MKTLTDCIDIVVPVIDFVLALLLNFNVYNERGEHDQIGVSPICKKPLFNLVHISQVYVTCDI